MTDKSWMLNPKAIRQAKECIQLVRVMPGVKLKLSDPNFIQQLHSFVETTGSRDLGEAYARLISMAGVGAIIQSLAPRDFQDESYQQAAGDELSVLDQAATVDHFGKRYPKYRSGLKFKGVYRGQPMYS